MKQSKVRTSLYIDKGLLNKAKQNKINLSRFLEEKLKEYFDDEKKLNEVDKYDISYFEVKILNERRENQEKTAESGVARPIIRDSRFRDPGSNPGRSTLPRILVRF